MYGCNVKTSYLYWESPLLMDSPHCAAVLFKSPRPYQLDQLQMSFPTQVYYPSYLCYDYNTKTCPIVLTPVLMAIAML